MRRLAAILLCVTCAGCQGRAITDLGGVRITLIGSPNTIQVVDDTANAQVGAQKFALVVANGRLSINGQDYGQVAKGDEVTIAGDRITINGKQATPTPVQSPKTQP